jgi:hypothetical protein
MKFRHWRNVYQNYYYQLFPQFFSVLQFGLKTAYTLPWRPTCVSMFIFLITQNMYWCKRNYEHIFHRKMKDMFCVQHMFPCKCYIFSQNEVKGNFKLLSHNLRIIGLILSKYILVVTGTFCWSDSNFIWTDKTETVHSIKFKTRICRPCRVCDPEIVVSY